MQLKKFFQKKLIIFVLAFLSFILLLIAGLVVGLVGKGSSVHITLIDISRAITNIKEDGSVDVPQYYFHSFWLITFGIFFSGLAVLFLGFNLFRFKRINVNYQLEFWRIGLFFVLTGMVLTLAGETNYADKMIMYHLDTAEFGDVWNIGKFVGLLICIILVPLPTFVLGVLWYPEVKES